MVFFIHIQCVRLFWFGLVGFYGQWLFRYCYMECTTWTLTNRLERKTRRKLHRNVESSIEQVLATTPHETPTIREHLPPITKKLYKLDEPDHAGTLLEKQGRAHKRCTPMDPHIWMCKKQDDQHETYLQQLCEDTGM